MKKKKGQKKTEYLNALEKLFHCSQESTETEELISAVFPHVSETQIYRLMHEASMEWEVKVVCPPVLADDTGHVVGLVRHKGSDSQRLRYLFTQRYPMPPDTNYQFAGEALAYARQHWGNELVQEGKDWKGYASIELQDPGDRDKDGFLQSQLILYFTLSQTWDAILRNFSVPPSEALNAAIGEITHFTAIGKELKGQRSGSRYYNCYCCGGGLSLTRCNGCGMQFPDKGFRMGWQTPLPRKLVNYLKTLDVAIYPMHAWDLERIKWRQERREIVKELGTGNGMQLQGTK